jgi:hypothetical protein
VKSILRLREVPAARTFATGFATDGWSSTQRFARTFLLKLPELYGIVEPSFTWRTYLMRKAAFLPQFTNKNDLCVAKDCLICFGLPPIQILAVFWVSNRITKPIYGYNAKYWPSILFLVEFLWRLLAKAISHRLD